MADSVEQLREVGELHKRGSLNFNQYQKAKTQLLGQTQEAPPSPKEELQIELAALDRHWEVEREKFKITWGLSSFIPTKEEIARKVEILLFQGRLFAALTSVAAIVETVRSGDPSLWLASVVVVIATFANIVWIKSWNRSPLNFERAEARYQRQRAEFESRIRALS